MRAGSNQNKRIHGHKPHKWAGDLTESRNVNLTCKFNPLNAELNPICHLLALLGGATIVVVSRLRVKYFNNFKD